MSKEEIKDCVQFKNDLYEKSWKKSGAKNIDEYVKYVSEHVKNSPLWTKAHQDGNSQDTKKIPNS